MTDTPYKAAIVGLGYIGGADQVSGDALGQLDSILGKTVTDDILDSVFSSFCVGK